MRRTALAPFGVEVHGLDLASVPGSSAPTLALLIAEARVVVFRDQAIDDEAFVRFLEGLGPLTFTAGETPVAGVLALNVVSNTGRSSAPRSVFHTDTSYVKEPPSYTALRPVVLPHSGGPTLFSDQVAAARRLPARAKDWLRGRTVLHQATGVAGVVEANRHPLFRIHPLTGEVSLYLSTPERCGALSDMDGHTSKRVLALLYRHSTKPSRIYRHRWRAGDILIWDNRVTMHRADHDAVAGDRVLHRGMVAGEVPSSPPQ